MPITVTFREWMQIRFNAEELADIANHGANRKRGMTTHKEISTLYRRFYKELWDLLLEDAQSMGVGSLELIGKFAKAKGVENPKRFEDLMVWYAAERYAALSR